MFGLQAVRLICTVVSASQALRTKNEEFL